MATPYPGACHKRRLSHNRRRWNSSIIDRQMAIQIDRWVGRQRRYRRTRLDRFVVDKNETLSAGVRFPSSFPRRFLRKTDCGFAKVLPLITEQELARLMNGPVKEALKIPKNVTWGAQSSLVMDAMEADFMRPALATGRRTFCGGGRSFSSKFLVFAHRILGGGLAFFPSDVLPFILAIQAIESDR